MTILSVCPLLLPQQQGVQLEICRVECEADDTPGGTTLQKDGGNEERPAIYFACGACSSTSSGSTP